MLRQAPVLVTLPPALASPVGPGGIGPHPDTPALLHVSLPGGGPLGGELMMQTALLSPTGQLQQLNSLVGPPGGGGGSGGGAGGAGAYRPGPLSSSGRGGVLKVRWAVWRERLVLGGDGWAGRGGSELGVGSRMTGQLAATLGHAARDEDKATSWPCTKHRLLCPLVILLS